MSRINLIEQLKAPRKKDIFEFDFDSLTAPPLMALMTMHDVEELNYIATSIKYNGRIRQKYELIDAIMKKRGFRRAHSGTNRVVYNFLESRDIIAKVALDSVGKKDSPAEFINQKYFAPFCCKIFEVDPYGEVGLIERVNPISSIEEFISVKDDIFNLMVTKIIGKYVVDDLGTKSFMNFGIRQNAHGVTFGPVVIDFPYVFEMDGAKLICQNIITDKSTGVILGPCGGEIDYDAGFNKIICTKCGKTYTARDLAKHTDAVQLKYDDVDKETQNKIRHILRARVVDGNKIILDSGRSSNRYLTKEEFEIMSNTNLPTDQPIEVVQTIRKKRENIRVFRDKYYTSLQKQYYEDLAKKNPQKPVKKSIIADIAADEEETLYIDTVANTAITCDCDVAETVDTKTGKVIDPFKSIDELEKITFPEMASGEIFEPGDITEDEELVAEETTEPAPIIQEEAILPATVYSDEEVEAMAHEVASRLDDNVIVAETNNILEPEMDKNNPEQNPMTRPYAVMGGNVSVDANTKVPLEELEKPELKSISTEDTIVPGIRPLSEVLGEDYNPDEDDVPIEVGDLEDEDEKPAETDDEVNDVIQEVEFDNMLEETNNEMDDIKERYADIINEYDEEGNKSNPRKAKAERKANGKGKRRNKKNDIDEY